jgi:hypothetical protein
LPFGFSKRRWRRKPEKWNLRKIESNKMKINLKQIAHIARVLQISIPALLIMLVKGGVN